MYTIIYINKSNKMNNNDGLHVIFASAMFTKFMFRKNVFPTERQWR